MINHFSQLWASKFESNTVLYFHHALEHCIHLCFHVRTIIHIWDNKGQLPVDITNKLTYLLGIFKLAIWYSPNRQSHQLSGQICKLYQQTKHLFQHTHARNHVIERVEPLGGVLVIIYMLVYFVNADLFFSAGSVSSLLRW